MRYGESEMCMRHTTSQKKDNENHMIGTEKREVSTKEIKRFKKDTFELFRIHEKYFIV